MSSEERILIAPDTSPIESLIEANRADSESDVELAILRRRPGGIEEVGED